MQPRAQESFILSYRIFYASHYPMSENAFIRWCMFQYYVAQLDVCLFHVSDPQLC